MNDVEIEALKGGMVSLEGLSSDNLTGFDVIAESPNVDTMFEQVLKLQAELVKKRDSDRYKMVDVLRIVIEQFADWRSDFVTSENTVYRRFATILDSLFRGTKVISQDGECVSQCAKDTVLMLQSISNSVSSASQLSKSGSKVDLLTIAILSNNRVEFASREWKRDELSEAIKLKQQAKNLRTNAAILSSLIMKGSSPYLMAMDWLGTVGYAYVLTFKEGVFVAQPVSPLMVPKQPSELKEFKQTLDFLFKWKNFLSDSIQKVEKNNVSSMNSLRGIMVMPNTYDEVPVHLPRLIITPRPSRKRYIEEVDVEEPDHQ
ncbi:hypothetical protein BJV82DRAFT_583385 [Fennellomyces sp. T-0311]|nr:hypothetical protein BJV82DRAFT_583385 [Fennellomyces sp. T-0311]